MVEGRRASNGGKTGLGFTDIDRIVRGGSPREENSLRSEGFVDGSGSRIHSEYTCCILTSSSSSQVLSYAITTFSTAETQIRHAK